MKQETKEQWQAFAIGVIVGLIVAGCIGILLYSLMF